MKLTKIAVVLVVSLLAFSLAACSSPKDSEATSTSSNTDIATLLATQPKNAEEAAELHQKLMQKENEILSSNSKLWEKVFLAANKDMPMIEDGKNYGDFLLDTIEGAKDQFSAEELKTLKTGAHIKFCEVDSAGNKWKTGNDKEHGTDITCFMLNRDSPQQLCNF